MRTIRLLPANQPCHSSRPPKRSTPASNRILQPPSRDKREIRPRYNPQANNPQINTTTNKPSKAIGGFNRGYERLRAQNFEKRAKGDLKEGFYLGKDLPLTDAYVVNKRFGQGPNKYTSEVTNPAAFRLIMDQYHDAMIDLAVAILQVLARTLDQDKDAFGDFCDHPVSILRLLHYPPQVVDTSDQERGKLTRTSL